MTAAEDDLHAPLDHSGIGFRADCINSTTSNLESAVGFVASLGIVTMEGMGKEEHSSEKLTNQAGANPNRVTPSHFLESTEARLRRLLHERINAVAALPSYQATHLFIQ